MFRYTPSLREMTSDLFTLKNQVFVSLIMQVRMVKLSEEVMSIDERTEINYLYLQLNHDHKGPAARVLNKRIST